MTLLDLYDVMFFCSVCKLY